MFRLLPVHLLKLRWLLFNSKELVKRDREVIQEIQQNLSKVNYQVACPVTIYILDKIYANTKENLACQ